MKIKDRRSFLVTVSSFLVSMGISRISLADKSATKIEAPETAKAGSEVTIKIHVRHHGNSLVHYTEWARLSINGKELTRWEFSASDRPEAENFTREVRYKISKTVTVEAEANCILHGSAGPAKWTIKVE